ncbi:MAG: pantetheine-phosphate adenylyltransferase [Muribaculaceae bacterium]|jgi:pantetheine-phosphate adenylyltransferase|nr:pantetheine-phosphate adenylyltransferase [Muribaculaceae bacterium]
MKTSQCIDSKSKRIALFPGSFDPFTRGHESIVRRALPLFDKFIIAIGVNADKRSFMTMEQRKAWIESIFKNDEQVQVIAYTGLTVDIAREVGAQFIVRGVRLIQDFENEKHLAEVNRDLTGIETILLYTLPEYSHISSSIVRELVHYGQDVAPYLPEGADFSQLPNK